MIPIQNDPANSKGPKSNLKYKNKVCHFLRCIQKFDRGKPNSFSRLSALTDPKSLLPQTHLGHWGGHTAMIFLMVRNLVNCVTQLKLDTVEKLSSPIFCCLSVCLWGIGNTWPNLHFFQYIQAYKPFADHVPSNNTKQYQLILTKYQPVSSYTDPVPSSTTYNSSFDESRTVYLV